MYVHFFFFLVVGVPTAPFRKRRWVPWSQDSQPVKIEFYVYYSEKFYSRQKRTKTRGGIRREVKVAVNVTWEKTQAFLIGKRVRMKFVRNRESVGVQEKKKTKSLLDSFGGGGHVGFISLLTSTWSLTFFFTLFKAL